MIPLATFTTPEEAHLFRSYLAAEGIEAFIFDESIAQLCWHYSNAIGGVRVVVFDTGEEDFAENVDAACRNYMSALRSEPALSNTVRAWPIVLLLSLFFGIPCLLFGRRPPATDQDEATEEMKISRRALRSAGLINRPPLWLLYLYSYAIVFLICLLDHALRWTDWQAGIRSGLLEGAVIAGIFVAIFVVPWSLITILIERRRKNTKGRTFAVLFPSIVFAAVWIGALVFFPSTAKSCFRQATACELPNDLQDLRYDLRDSALIDPVYIYHFRTSSAEVDRLIREMNLSPNIVRNLITKKIKLKSIPAFVFRKDAKIYHGMKGKWFFTLVTDAANQEVYITIDGI